MHEPSIRSSRLAIASGLAAAIAVGGTGFFLGRTTAPQPAPAAPVVLTAPAPVPTPAASPVADVLGRAEMVALAQQAASAFAAGRPPPESVSGAADRRFELLLPFGCAGPSDENSTLAMQWRYDEADQALRISAAPVVWSAAEWGLENQAGADIVEGFWITRPWSTGDACPVRSGPAMPAGMEPITLPGQTLAIGQFFSGDADRDARRDGRPFETVRRVPADRFDGSQGFRVRVLGRIASVPGGGAVRCIQPAGIEQRPICIVGVRMEEVRIENGATGETVATWPIGRSG